MNYQEAYLYLFNKLTDTIAMLEKLDPSQEKVNIVPLLKFMQSEAEEKCTRRQARHAPSRKASLQ